jgi:hypothetical protein
MADSLKKLWLAVDSNDHVACFFPGQAGPVPHCVPKLVTEHELNESLPEEHQSAVQHTLFGRLEPDPENPRRHIPTESKEKIGRSLLFLTSLDPVLHLLASGEAQIVDSEDHLGVLVKMLHRDDALRIHDGQHCVSCFWPRSWEEQDRALPKRGLFRYDHLCEAWISGPYGCALQPREALQLDQLSKPLRDLCQATRFNDLQFVQSPRVQPAEQRPCHCSEFGFLDSQGEVREPLKGPQQ